MCVMEGSGVNRISEQSPPICEHLGIIGKAPGFVLAFGQLARFARADVPVLLTGETGTGKELAARACHYGSLRADRAFVSINCGALPDHMFESELFGHAAGAYTDARSARAGLVMEADHGTLFLDEVDSLSPHGQVALLRLLQDGSFRPLGSDREKFADLRVVAATNAPLEELAAGVRLRSDLLYRLDVARVHLPPLRERRGDIVPLARHFLNRIALRGGKPVPRLCAEVQRRLVGHGWPGNVRELENVIERAVLLSAEEWIDLEALPRAPDAAPEPCLELGTARAESVAAFERAYLARLLDQSGGNITTAARLAGTERRHLGRMIKRNGINSGQFRN